MPSILVVEDDEVISSSIKELLEDYQFSVTTAYNGREALEKLRIETHGLILLDLMMPVMDGFEFRVNQLADPKLKDIPVVIMSADGHVEEKQKQTAALDYLRKPVDVLKLLETVKRVARP